MRVVYRFGVFEFRPATGELWRDGVRTRLEPQPARALAMLLAQPGELVTREALRHALWGDDTHVDFDRGLAYCIGQIRTALGDTAENPRFVQTLPRRGFRFIAPVEIPGERPAAVAGEPPPRRFADTFTGRVVAVTVVVLFVAAAWLAWPRSAASRPVVAVAVFDNETGLAEHDRMVAGMADVVVDRLTALGPARLGVVGNTSAVRAPRESRDLGVIQQQTGATYLVMGQFQQDPAGLRLIVHLIRLDDGTHLWVTRIVRAPGELAGMEALAAERTAEAVRAHVIERAADAPRATP